MRSVAVLVAAVLAWAWCAGVAGAATAPPFGHAEQLPTGPAWLVADRCIPIKEAATRVPGQRATASPSASRLSSLDAALRQVPATLRSHVEACPWGDNWLVAPAGWRERKADIGADGDAIWVFTAPRGKKDGWLKIASTPACTSCMLSGAEGYFPDAHRLYVARYGPEPRVTLSPKPRSLTHPDPCTAWVAYPARGLQVRNQQYWVPPLKHLKHGTQPGLLSVSVALPPGQARLRKAMLASVWGGRPPRTRYCPAALLSKHASRGPIPATMPTGNRGHGAQTSTNKPASQTRSLSGTVAAAPRPVPDNLPHTWRLYHKRMNGAGGITATSFVAPRGASHGWAVIARYWPYTGGSKLAGNGLLPHANAIMHGSAKTAHGEKAALVPRPVSLRHPNRCTAVFSYRLNGLRVEGVARIADYDRSIHASTLYEMYIALPPGNAATRHHILKSFKGSLPTARAATGRTCTTTKS